MPQKKVLVIEDDKYLNKIYVEGLTKAGYKVYSVMNGEGGLEIARKEIPDIIVLDLMLPGMQGEEVARELKERISTEKIPIIVLSNKGDAALTSELGVEEHHLKINVLMEDLVHLIEKHIGR